MSMQNIQTTKDDIIKLIRLFKEPMTQKYCTNQHAVIKWGDYILAGISQCSVKKYPTNLARNNGHTVPISHMI